MRLSLHFRKYCLLILIYILIFISSNSYANAIMPITNMWQKPTPSFFIAYILIVLVETLLFWKIIRGFTLLKCLRNSLIINVESSLVGSIFIYLFFNVSSSHMFTEYDNFVQKLITFFILTVISEGLLVYLLFKVNKILRLVTIVFVVNIISYLFFFLFQFVCYTTFFAFYNYKHDSYLEKWNIKNNYVDLKKVIIAYSIFNGENSTRKFILMQDGNKQEDELDVVRMSYPYMIIRPKSKKYSNGGYIYDYEKKKKVYVLDNTSNYDIFNSSNNRLIISIKDANLEGIPDSEGMRKMYGYSYSKFKLKEGKFNSLKINGTINEKLFEYNNDLFYAGHSKCEFESKEPSKTYKVGVCKKIEINIIRKTDNDESVFIKNVSLFQVVNDNVYFIKENKLMMRNISGNIESIVLDEKIDSFVISSNEKYLLAKKWAMRPLYHSYFLVLINLKTKKKVILEEGQIVAFDFVEI